jgi:APA family basic amino acid/polyamine antiporter
MNSEAELKKEIGLWGLVSLGVGGIIGSGIFSMPAVMGSVAGPSFIIAVVLVGLISLLLALIYAELGASYPLTGGPYSIPRVALGDFAGFTIGWGYFLYAFIGTAAIIDIFVTYAGFYFPGLSKGLTLTPLGITVSVAMLWLFTLVNVVGVKWGTVFGIITTVGKIIPLAIFGMIGLFMFNPDNLTPFAPFGFSGIGLAMAFDFWAFTGFEGVVIPSEEVKEPEKNIPRAMVITMSIVIAVYFIISLAFIGLLNWSGLELGWKDWGSIGNLSSPLADVSRAAGLGLLASGVTLGAIISTAGAGGDWVLFQGRIPYAMAKDGLFMKAMGKTHSRFKTPYVALIFASLLTMLIQILIPNFPSVALLASITTLIPYAAASLSLPLLRSKINKTKGFRLPSPSFFGFLGFFLSTLLIYWASWPWTFVGAILTLAGVAVMYLFGRVPFRRKDIWLLVYIIGIVLISFLGDKNFVFQNFLQISPVGLISMPYDILTIMIFSAVVYTWAIRANGGMYHGDKSSG